jgi:hypothetical protein
MGASFLQSLSNSISQQELEERTQGVLRRVYMWMTLGLFMTAATSYFTLNIEPLFMLVARYWGFFLIGELVMVFGLSWVVDRLPLPLALGGFLLYAMLNGATIALIVLSYTASQVLTAFLSTACLFGAMTLIGFTTKIDLTKMGGFLLMALLGLIIGSVINMFLASDGLDWILTFAGIAIFIGLTAYDTQRIKHMTAVALSNGSTTVETSVGVRGALILYLDFINLFLRILRLFGRRR